MTTTRTDYVSRSQRRRRRSVTGLLEDTEQAIRDGTRMGTALWPTRFDLLDTALSGGLRSGELVIISGAQGQGKSTLAMQFLRNAVVAGRTGVIFSYEQESHTVVQRLLSLEAAEAAGEEATNAAGVTAMRNAFEVLGGTLEERVSSLPFGKAALETVSGYGPRLHVHEANSGTTLDELWSTVADVRTESGDPPLVLIDYLQKVPVPGHLMDETDRLATIAESLKDLALEMEVPVIAVSTTERNAVTPGQRLRTHHLRGASSLAYESDIVLMLNAKEDVVSREHLIYDLSNAKRFSKWAVLSVEKNRHGINHVEFEFEKDFGHARFLRNGREVAERLVEERVYTS